MYDLACSSFLIWYKIAQKQNIKNKKCWARKWVDRRIDLGTGSTLINEMWLDDALIVSN